MDIKTVRIKEKAHTDLSRLAKEHGMTIGEFTEEMVSYFRRTKSDPRQIEDTVTSIKEVKKEVNRLIGFIKTNEKEHLNPILDSLEISRRNLNTNVDKLNNIEIIKQHVVPTYNRTKGIDESREQIEKDISKIINNQVIIDKKIETKTQNIVIQTTQIQARFNVLKELLIWMREFEEGFEKSMGGIIGYKKEEMIIQLSHLKKIIEKL